MPKKTPSRKTAVSKKKTTSVSKRTSPRVLPRPKKIWYKPWTWRRRLPAPPRKPIPKARIILWQALGQLTQNWKIYGSIVLIYGILNVILVRGFGTSDVTSIKSILDNVLTGLGGQVQGAFTSFVYLLTTSTNNGTTSASIYQGILVFIISLAFIWALRQTTAKQAFRVRDTFYRGMYPLIPFLLVIVIMGVELLPMTIGTSLYALVVGNNIALGFVEKAVFAIPALILIFWSLYMLIASFFALYIVTLPDMTPLRAIRSANELLYKRRLLIWRKVIFLPIVCIVAAALIEMPIIMFFPPAAEWVFFVLSMVALALVHAYFYKLYRDML